MQWVAAYRSEDGPAGLCQWPHNSAENDGKGRENRYADIDRARLTGFALFTDAGRKVIGFQLGEDQVLIYRRRVLKRSNQPLPEIIYMAGWHRPGTGDMCMAWVFPDGSIEILGRYLPECPFDSVELYPFEEAQCFTTA